jgi:hypothetical protein
MLANYWADGSALLHLPRGLFLVCSLKVVLVTVIFTGVQKKCEVITIPSEICDFAVETEE